MTDPESSAILTAVADLREIVEKAAAAALGAREIAASAVDLANDNASNVEAIRNDVADHARLDSKQHAEVSNKIDSLYTLHRETARNSSADREAIMVQLNELTEIKQFFTNAKGARQFIVGFSGIVVALSAIGTAMWGLVHFVKWLIGFLK